MLHDTIGVRSLQTFIRFHLSWFLYNFGGSGTLLDFALAEHFKQFLTSSTFISRLRGYDLKKIQLAGILTKSHLSTAAKPKTKTAVYVWQSDPAVALRTITCSVANSWIARTRKNLRIYKRMKSGVARNTENNYWGRWPGLRLFYKSAFEKYGGVGGDVF